jgi:NAD(P)-dependent dehydrogenase (short-subunit alcohol dehydrogenase family)
MADAQIIVTGASRGIGAAIAAELSRRGRRVAGLSRSGTTGAGTGYACDVTDEDALRDCFARIAGSGPIAGLVNNAGMHLGSPSAQLDTAEYQQVMAVNATAVMVAAREIYPYLRENGGTIVNIGSFFDKLGVPGTLAYCASKAAVGAITRCLAVEWAADGIRVLDIAPGYVETDLNRDFLNNEKVRRFLEQRIPTGGAGAPADVARLVAAVFDEAIPYLTGETIYLDGAQGVKL